MFICFALFFYHVLQMLKNLLTQSSRSPSCVSGHECISSRQCGSILTQCVSCVVVLFFFLTAQISNCEKSAWPQAANWALWIQLAVHRPLLHCSDWRHSTGCRSSFISSVHQRLSDVSLVLLQITNLKQSSDQTDPVFTVTAAFYYASIF